MSFLTDQGIVLIVIVFIVYLGYREWLRHQRRQLLHAERLAAIEKGADVPSLENETRRSAWNVQRALLLAVSSGSLWASVSSSH
jgi:small-conductance mechanosensitive channel